MFSKVTLRSLKIKNIMKFQQYMIALKKIDLIIRNSKNHKKYERFNSCLIKNDYRYENITLVETKQAYLENSIVKLFQTQVHNYCVHSVYCYI